MKEEEIVKKVCEIMGVKYSHYDNHDMRIDYFPYLELDARPKIVVYSSKFGPWELAILENMTVVTPLHNVQKTMKSLLLELNDNSDNIKKTLKDLEVTEEKFLTAETFLKENNCAAVINDKTKK